MNEPGDAMRGFKPLVLDEAIPVRCECCDPARQIQHVRTGPTSQIHYCPTTRAAYLPKRLHDGKRILVRGFYSGDIE